MIQVYYVSPSGYDSVWVIVDCLTETAHFILVKTTYSMAKLAQLYVDEIVILHWVPVSIIFYRGLEFTSRLWKTFHEAMGTRLDLSIAFHPQTDDSPRKRFKP